ncbi:MAG: prolyl oligopeptidase family serine peptidase [Thermoplasmatota archaeon]
MKMAARKRSFAFDDMMRIDRLSDPAPHPDGSKVAYVTTKYDKLKNEKCSVIHLLDMESGEDRLLTPGKGSYGNPSWSHDGRYLAFTSDRDEGSQLYVLPFAEGGESRKITEGDGGAGKPVWNPDGNRILFSRSVVVSPEWDGNTDDIAEDEKKRVIHARTYGLVNERSSARIEDSLLYRHWDHWREMRRTHLFIVDLSTSEISDITPGDADVPPISLGGSLDYGFSPEGDEIVYIMNPDDVVAESTNNSVYIQKIKGINTSGKPKRISRNEAMDLEPRYSPDGKYICYLGAEKPTYEADRLRIKIYDRETGSTKVLTEDLDRSPFLIEWSLDSRFIIFTAPDRGYLHIFSYDLKTDSIRRHTGRSYNSVFRQLSAKKIIVSRESATEPADLYVMDVNEGVRPDTDPGPMKTDLPQEKIERLTEYGSWMKKELDIHHLEEFWYNGADEDPVHGFILKPPGFDRKKKYPLVLIIHGGPQSAFFDHFHFRWNPQLFAGSGYVVAELNPRGSIGYGQEFTDQISGDWGGRCYEDIMRGLDHVLDNYPFIDRERIAAAGASFGGFMVNWIAGHTDRFKVLVSHDGIFNQETMSYMTEELWFDRWEHGGYPHEDHESFLKYSPHMHVQNFKTPMLVIQGELDFRCPVSEGVALFTALQVMKVPSRFLYFPDEGHWVLKPANLEVWYDTVLDWIGRYI